MNPLSNKKKTTLAIFPTSKGFGYAMMSAPLKPIDYAFISVKNYTLKTYKERIAGLLDFFKPTVVVVESNLKRKSNKVKAMIEAVKSEANIQHLSIYKYSRSDIKSLFKNFECTTKYEIVSFIQKEIPELQDRKGGRKNIWDGEAYYTPVFDAISLAMTHYYNS